MPKQKEKVTTRGDILNALDSVQTVLRKLPDPALKFDVRVSMSTGATRYSRPPAILVFPPEKGRGVFGLAEHFGAEAAEEMPQYHVEHYHAYGFRFAGVDVYELMSDREHEARMRANEEAGG